MSRVSHIIQLEQASTNIAAICSNLLQNLGFYAAVDDLPADEQKWKTQTSKQVARDRMQSFHPALHKLLDYCNEDDMYLWRVADRDPLPTYHKDRLIVLGDAAHPMLPTLGNGAGMAIEDAGALGVVMEGVKDAGEVTRRLNVWDRVRRPRASAVQLLSRNIGVEYEISRETQDMVREYLSEEQLPEFTRACVNRVLFSYDCLGEARRAVRDSSDCV
jgi:salicylate hydroxylase